MKDKGKIKLERKHLPKDLLTKALSGRHIVWLYDNKRKDQHFVDKRDNIP